MPRLVSLCRYTILIEELSRRPTRRDISRYAQVMVSFIRVSIAQYSAGNYEYRMQLYRGVDVCLELEIELLPEKV